MSLGRVLLVFAVKPVTREQASDLGILKVGRDGRITDFYEKPQTQAELDALQLDLPPGDHPGESFLASMGIYLFESQVMTSLLMSTDKEDFGRRMLFFDLQDFFISSG